MFKANNLSLKHACKTIVLIRVLSTYLFLSYWIFSAAQSPMGLPVIRNYSPLEYASHRQNWGIDQAPDGYMYFANGKGLLSFNGEAWSLAMIPNRGHVRSLDIDEDGTVFVGANNDLGVLVSDQEGNLKFRSYLSLIDPLDHNFDRVRVTLSHPDGIYFQSYHRIFRKDRQSDTVKTWRFSTTCYRIFEIKGTLYAWDLKEGLRTLDNTDEWRSIPIENLDSNLIVTTMFAFGEKIMMVSRSHGLFLFNGNQMIPFLTSEDNFLKTHQISSGLLTSNNLLVLTAAENAGIVILNADGQLHSFLNQSHGLSSNNVLSVYEDRQGSLWIGLQEGIARVDINSDFSIFDERVGLEGTVQDIQQHQKSLFVGTSSGVVKSAQGRFIRVGGIESYIWDLDAWRDQLIIATSKGAFALKNGAIIPILSKDVLVSEVSVSKFDPFSICLALDDGFVQFQWIHNQWTEVGSVNGIAGAVRDIVEMQHGVFWLKTRSNGVFKVNLPVHSDGILDFNQKEIVHYTKEKGVSIGENNLYEIGNTLYLRSEQDSLFRYNRGSDQFVFTNNLAETISISNGYVLPKTNDVEGVFWADWIQDDQMSLIKVHRNLDGSFHYDSYPINLKVFQFKDPFGNEVFFGKGSQAWYGGMNGVLQFNLIDILPVSNKPRVLLSRVYANDSLIYAYHLKSVEPIIPFSNNDLDFYYSAPVYSNAENLQYKIWLEGYDKVWSKWSIESKKTYTNLPEGDYTFHITARNDFLEESETTIFSFMIKPPWHRSIGAVIAYFILVGGLIWLIVYLRSQRYRRENVRLEAMVQERTLEVRRQADEIKDLYMVKSNFLANVSHELRTPLTLILGPVTNLLSQSKNKENREQLLWIQKHAGKLLNMINQLLDLSKIEDGKLELKATPQDIVFLTKGIVNSFESLATQKKVKLGLDCSLDELIVYLDADKYDQVLTNLISNAIKFTPEYGVVDIQLELFEQQEKVKIIVSDSGIGIDQENLDRIFERFYQVDDNDNRSYQGTGIGLSLTRELVELHSGEISVKSQKGMGARFEILLPVGKEYLQEAPVYKQVVSKSIADSSAKYEVNEESAPSDSAKHELILVVDDHKDMRNYIEFQLSERYHIIQAESGKIGLEIALERQPDLIISDVMMPGISGFEFCKMLKSDIRTDHIPVILLTAKVGKEDKIKGLHLQADEYLNKPFIAEELKARIKNLIKGRKLLQKRFAEKIIFKPEQIATTPQEAVFLDQLITTIEKHLGDSLLDVELLSHKLGMSKSQLNRKMKAILAKSPNQFIRSYRLERAKYLIEQNTGTIAEIAYDVGFSSPAYFSKCFMDEYGYPPSNLKN